MVWRQQLFWGGFSADSPLAAVFWVGKRRRCAGDNGVGSAGSWLLCLLRLHLLSCCNTLTLVRLSVSCAAERVVYAALSSIYGVMGCAEDPGIIGEMSGSGLAACLGGRYLEIYTHAVNV